MAEVVTIVGIGDLWTGDLDAPVADSDAIRIEGGEIVGVGTARSLTDGASIVDVRGATLAPGLIDNHIHPVLGDFTPRVSQMGFLEGFVHGGVTSMVSAGEVHTPGRPKDAAGTKALALLAHRAYQSFRPLGAKVHAGALLLEDGLEEKDFVELAGHGVHLVGEIGISGIQEPGIAQVMTRWAQAAGMTVTVHVGGKSVATSCTIDGEFVCTVRPDVAAHVNGGPTATSLADVRMILDETDAFVELVHNGNVRALRDVGIDLAERGALSRLVLGTDSPAGAGIAPAGILRVITWLTSLAGIAPPEAVAAATGNTASARHIPGGRIAAGQPADLVVLDAPEGSRGKDAAGAMTHGDSPAVAAVFIDGQPVVRASRNTPPPKRTPHFPARVDT